MEHLHGILHVRNNDCHGHGRLAFSEGEEKGPDPRMMDDCNNTIVEFA